MGRVLATNLSHDHHQGDRSDVSTLPTHIAACDDLKARLLCRVDVVWYEFGLHDLLLDWVSALLDSQSVCELWLGCRGSARLFAEGKVLENTVVVHSYKLCERSYLDLSASIRAMKNETITMSSKATASQILNMIDMWLRTSSIRFSTA